MEGVCFVLTTTADLAPNTRKDDNILALNVTESLINTTASNYVCISS
jgi:hypothetical protein